MPFINALALPVYFFALNENMAKSFCYYPGREPNKRELKAHHTLYLLYRFACNYAESGLEKKA
jgi:hypothetical protein